MEPAGPGLGVDAGDRSAGVLGGIGERLGDDIIGSDLDRRRETRLDFHVNLDGECGTASKHLERWSESSLRQDRWVDAARNLSELFQRLAQPVRDPVKPGL